MIREELLQLGHCQSAAHAMWLTLRHGYAMRFVQSMCARL